MYKVRLKFEKKEYSSYISHLDLMQTLQRSLIRAALPVKYTSGFNPHIYLSILVPLSTGYQSEYDLCDFELMQDAPPEDLIERINAALPHGLKALEYRRAVTPINEIAWCEYEISYPCAWSPEIPAIFEKEVRILKHSKRGDKEVVLADYARKIVFEPTEEGFRCRCILRAGDDPLNPAYLTDILRFHNYVSSQDRPTYLRKSILDEQLAEFF